MIFHTVLFFVILSAETAIVVESLAVDRSAVGAGLQNSLQTLSRAHVDEVNRRTGPFRNPKYPSERNIFRLGAVNQVHVVPLGPLLAGQLLVHVLDHIVIFSVDQQHGVHPLDLFHQVVQVSGAHHAGLAGGGWGPDIGGENLNAWVPIFHGLVQRTQNLRWDGAQQHQMMRVVGVGITLPRLCPFLNRLGNINAWILDGEVHQRGGPTN